MATDVGLWWWALYLALMSQQPANIAKHRATKLSVTLVFNKARVKGIWILMIPPNVIII